MKSVFWAALCFAAVSASAEPMLFNKCNNVRIKSVPNGAGVYLSEDCKTAYVLPPTTGSFKIVSATVTENLRLCPAIEASLNVIASQYKQLEVLNARLQNSANGNGSNGNGSTLFPGNPSGNGRVDTGALQEAIKEANTVATELNEMLKTYAGVEGSEAQGIMDSQHQALVQAYQDANPGIQFVPITIAESQLRFNRRGVTGNAFLPVVLSFEVPGRPVISGDGTASPDAATIYGGIGTGQLILSLAGACPFYNASSQQIDLNKMSNGRSLATYFDAKVNYTYNLQIHRSYHAEFNARGFFKRLQESESSGGFFSTKTVNRLIMERESNDWFVFKSTSQDPSVDWDEKLSETVKAEMIDRTLRQIAMLGVGGPEAAPPMATPQADGASKSAEALQKCPYVYCQIGAAVLQVADAIWGNTRSISDFLNSYSGTEIEDVDEAKMLPFQGATVFQE